MRNKEKTNDVSSRYSWLVCAAIVLTACGGGGGDGPAPLRSTAPRVSNLVLTPDSVPFRSGDGSAVIEVQVDVTDPEADVADVHVALSDGSNVTIPVTMSPGVTSDTLSAEFNVSTTTGRIMTAEVWVTDRANNLSNRLSSSLTVEGSSALAALSLGSSALDQLFDSANTNYSADVPFLTSGIDVLFEKEDPGASIIVNGEPVDSATAVSVLLDSGINTIRVDVKAATDDTPVGYVVEVIREPVDNLAQTTYVKDWNANRLSRFGDALAVDGDLMAIGAPWDSSGATGINGNEFDNSVTHSGAVYLLERDGAGLWYRQSYIKASNPSPDDEFGGAVDLDGNTLVIGAAGEDSAATGIDGDQEDFSAPGAGAVYVFVRDDLGLWSQQAYIKASNTETDDRFGVAVAIDGDTLVVAASAEDGGAAGVGGDQGDNSQSSAGAVYVFERDAAGNWAQQAYIKASNPDAADFFGAALAIDGDTLVVGAFGEDSASTGIDGDQADNSAIDFDPITGLPIPDPYQCGAGAAYAFHRRPGNGWTQEAYLKASNAIAGDCFGVSVSISGNTVAIGAEQHPVDDRLGPFHQGAAYVFVVDDERAWFEQAIIQHSRPTVTEYFGNRLALVGNTLAVAAPLECSITRGVNNPWMPGLGPDWCADPVARIGEGAVFVFDRDSARAWSQRAYVKASNTLEYPLNSGFGSQLALSSDTLVVFGGLECGVSTGINGDQTQNCSTTSHYGAVYVIE